MMSSGSNNLKSRLLAKCFLIAIAIVICAFFTASQCPAADLVVKPEGRIFKNAGKLKAFKKRELKVAIVTVSVPIKITDLPGAWRNADLAVYALTYFYSKGNNWKDGTVGKATGKTIKSQVLQNGSFKGVESVPLYEQQGAITGQYITLAFVCAKLGDQAKILGYGYNFPSGSGGLDNEMIMGLNSTIDKVMSWSMLSNDL